MRRLAPALAALAALSLATGCQVFDPMMQQQKVKAYQRSGFYRDGLGMREPPAGTVPQERPLDPAVLTGRGPDGKLLATSPVPATRALLQDGRKHFEIYCAACHGLVGDGDSMVARNMSLRPPPSIHQFTSFPDGWYYQVISLGFGLMPSYATQLSPEERWAVVAYVRALQLSQKAALERVPADERRRLEEARP